MAVNEQLVERSARGRQRGSLVSSVVSVLERHPVLFVFFVALLVRAFVVATIGFLPESYVFAVDNSTYSGMATSVVTGAAEKWDEGTRGLYDSTFTFMGPVTLIYFLTDSSEVAAELYVALLGAGAAALVARLGMEFLPRPLAVVAGLIVGLLPSQVLWSSLLLKDAAVWLVLAGIGVAVAVAGRKTGGRMVGWVLVVALLLLSLAYLRGHTTVVAAWALGVAGFAGIRSQRWSRGALTLLVAVAVPWMAGLGPAGYSFVAGAGSLEYRRAANAIGAQSAFVEALSPEELSGEAALPAEADGAVRNVAFIEEKVAQVEDKVARLKETVAQAEESVAQADDNADATAPELSSKRAEAAALKRELARLEQQRAALLAAKNRAAQQQQRAAQAPATQDEGIDPNVAHLPRGLSVMLLEPFPWSAPTSPTFQLARGEALLWYPLLALALAGLWRSRRHLRSLTFPLLAGGGILLVYALAEGNIGTAFRHRGELVWVVALLAGLGLQQAMAWRGDRSKPFEEG